MEPKNLRNDAEWAAVDNRICRVTAFKPFAHMSDGRIVESHRGMPYALVTLEVPGLPPDTMGGIAHRVDFMNLWKVFRETQLTDDEEVHVAWIKSSLRPPAKWFSRFMPGLVVMVFKSGAYELMTTDCRPDLTGEARFKAECPIVELKPSIYG